MKINEVSKSLGLSPDTLRYYEKQGLLGEIPRNEKGIRDYTEENLECIEYIKYMRTTGISIESLAEFIRLTDMGDSTVEDRKTILLEQRKQIENRLEEVKECLRRIDVKLNLYDETGKNWTDKKVVKRCRRYEEDRKEENNGNN